MATYFKRPFAQDGLKVTIPVDTTLDGSVSLQEGWGTDYELDPVADPTNAKFPEMRVFNEFFYNVSDNIKEWQEQSYPDWIADKGDGTPYSYSKYSVVRYTNGNAYISTENNNNEEPTTGTKWVIIEDFGNFVNKNFTTLTAKTTPDDNDVFVINDSVSSFSLKKLTWENIKTALNLLYVGLSGSQSIGGTKNFTSSPTVPTPSSSDNSTNVATTAWNKLGLASSLGANGYIKLPTWLGGLILQWGTSANVPSDSRLTVTFPLAFPTSCLIALANYKAGATASDHGQSFGVANITSTNFQIENQAITTPFVALPATWFAIGY